MKNKTRNFIKRATALIIVLALFAFIALMFFGCAETTDVRASSADSSETAGTYAIIKLPNGEIVEGEVTRYTTGYASVQIVIDGVKYITQQSNVVIIKHNQ